MPVGNTPARNVRAALAFGALALLAGPSTCALLSPAGSGQAPSLHDATAGTLAIEIFLAFSALAGASLAREPLGRRLGLGPSCLSPAVLLLAVAGTLGLSHALDTAVTLSGLRPESVLEEIDRLIRGAGWRELAFAGLGLVLAPSLGEELMCRGFLQRGLASRIGGPAAIIASSAAFGALHLEWIQGTAAAVLGLYLGVLTWLSGSLRPAILCHAVNNAVALVIPLLIPAASAADGAPGGALVLGLATAAGGLLIAGVALHRVSASSALARAAVAQLGAPHLQPVDGLDDS